MKYIDLHCDALTSESVLQVTGDSLRAGGCALQCFAAFLREGEGFARALALCDKFYELCAREKLFPYRGGVLRKGVNAVLTVENGSATEGDLNKLKVLSERGVRMMTLTWNFENEIGYPNFDRAAPRRREREKGLKPFGRETVAAMAELSVLPDVSHGSDALVKDVAEVCKERGAPFVASHSGAAAVFPHARNLTDEGIRAVADSGGVVGLDFCAEFLSGDRTPEGQREALLAHAAHILDIGGEETLALGSDFDGIPENPYLRTPADMPRFLEELIKKFGEKTAEKIASRNALRVLQI